MKILIITLSNIGDVILTLPAMDILRRDFPAAEFMVLTGAKAAGIFKHDPKVHLVVYDKHSSVIEQFKLTRFLRRKNYDLLVDFRHTGFPLFLRSRVKTSLFTKIPPNILHKKAQHLFWLKTVHDFSKEAAAESIFIRPEDREYIELVLGRSAPGQKLVVISPGAANEWKRWTKREFAEVADQLIDEFRVKVVLVGGADDRPVVQDIAGLMRNHPLDLSGKTSLKQLAALLQKASLVVSCDSGVMHMASYLNVPVLAIFGPTDPNKYGPWSEKSLVVRNNDVECSPCEKSGCSEKHECMELIEAEQVFKAIRDNFSEIKNIEVPATEAARAGAAKPPKIFCAFADFLRFSGIIDILRRHKTARKDAAGGKKRVLVVRTDRIGDVLLTTPVFRALRENFPDSPLAVMVSPAAREIVEGNPYLDEVIIYDKDDKDKGWWGFHKFVWRLRKRHFDLALVLHTKKRTNLLCFLAGIKERVGYYDNKFGFLLTTKIPDLRKEGKKHETEYCLDVLRLVGIEAKDSNLFMPLKPEAERWADGFLLQNKVERKDQLIAINPGASCQSKRWPPGRFAILADKLAEKYSAKIAVISGTADLAIAQQVLSKIRHPVIDLSGKTSISQLASFLKRCNLFISNDSGPVHLSCAVGTPVVAIFGRNESGLSPTRWGPVGKKNIVLHKDVGCPVCLAHNCRKGFACLLAITEEEVLAAAEKLLKAI
jgi:heptosyltransferase II